MIKRNDFNGLKKSITDIRRSVKELGSFYDEMDKTRDEMERSMIASQISALKKSVYNASFELKGNLDRSSLVNPLKQVKTVPTLPGVSGTSRKIEVTSSQLDSEKDIQEEEPVKRKLMTALEKQTIKRLKRKEKKVVVKKERKPSSYVGMANRLFSETSKSLLKKGMFRNLKRDLIKANMQFLARSYVSVILFNTIIALFVSIFIFIFFLFFNFGAQFPFLTMVKGGVLNRVGSVFWVLIVIPLGTFIITYLYPSMEKKTIELRINQELPFATIHMASISESLVEPSNIFKIVISTHEYPVIEKEFTKLLNEINVFGYDLVTALRNSAFNSPSKKLSELLDGLATTITSGGDLSDFFEKRAQTLLFDHKLDKEKQTKSAETFMDIYISVVIAAPMILMLLLIMMRVSGLGISLSTTMISIIMVLGVSVVNIAFLTFLQIKQQY